MYLETWSWSSLICAEKVPLQGSCYIELRKNMCFFNIFVLFIVDTTFILKLVFPTVYCFCLDGYFGGCVVAIIVTVVFVFIYLFIWFFVYLFIYLFIYSATWTVILIFVVTAAVAFVVGVIVAFYVYLVIVVNLMLMFSILVLLFVRHFTVNMF